MTRRIVALMMVMILLGTCDALTQTRPALYGSILRVFGMRHVPASGLKIILTKGDQSSTPVYTSPSGKFALYQLPAGFGKYTLQVFADRDLLKSMEIEIPRMMTRVTVRLQ